MLRGESQVSEGPKASRGRKTFGGEPGKSRTRRARLRGAILVGFGLALAGVISYVALAATNSWIIDSATVDGGSTTTVAPGSTISAAVTAHFNTPTGAWNGTRWLIGTTTPT